MKIRQHRPNYVTGLTPLVAEFESSDELLALPWVKRYAEGLRDAIFCVSKNSAGQSMLMVDGIQEHDGERTWWVIGWIEDGEASDLGLPVWHHATRTHGDDGS